MRIEDYRGVKLHEMTSNAILWCIEEGLSEMPEIELVSPVKYRTKSKDISLFELSQRVAEYLEEHEIDLQAEIESPVAVVGDYLKHMVRFG